MHIAPMKIHVQPASHGGHREQYSPFQSAMCKRWDTPQSFEETKTELGMAHYEVRKYPGWHHHMLTSMLAHFFLWHLKMRLGKKSPSADGVATAPLISGDPPLTHLHGSRGPRAGGVGPAVQSPGLSVAQKAS